MAGPKFTNAAGMYQDGFQVYDEDTGDILARSLTAPAAGFTIGNNTGLGGNPTFALADDLAGLEAMSGTGIVVRTAANTFGNSEVTGTGGIVIINGDGTAGDIIVDGSGITPTPGDSTTFLVSNDFTNTISLSASLGWDIVTSTPGTSVSGHPGIIKPSGHGGITGSSVTLDSGVITFTLIQEVTSNLVIHDIINYGLFDDEDADAIDNGAYFRANYNAGDRTNWMACTENAGTVTAQDTGVAINSTWKTMKIVTNTAGTSVLFYIDGALVATNTTDIPATDTLLLFGANVYSLATNTVHIDYISVHQLLASR